MQIVTVVTSEDLQAFPKKYLVIPNKHLPSSYTDLHYLLLLCSFCQERCRLKKKNPHTVGRKYQNSFCLDKLSMISSDICFMMKYLITCSINFPA